MRNIYYHTRALLGLEAVQSLQAGSLPYTMPNKFVVHPRKVISLGQNPAQVAANRSQLAHCHCLAP